MIVLVDENEQEYTAKYSFRKNRLSGGWRGFSVAHNLLEGDALVFHLIEPCKFRVTFQPHDYGPYLFSFIYVT